MFPLKAWVCLEVMADRAALASMAYKASATYEQVRPNESVESFKFFLEKAWHPRTAMKFHDPLDGMQCHVIPFLKLLDR